MKYKGIWLSVEMLSIERKTPSPIRRRSGSANNLVEFNIIIILPEILSFDIAHLNKFEHFNAHLKQIWTFDCSFNHLSGRLTFLLCRFLSEIGFELPIPGKAATLHEARIDSMLNQKLNSNFKY